MPQIIAVLLLVCMWMGLGANTIWFVIYNLKRMQGRTEAKVSASTAYRYHRAGRSSVDLDIFAEFKRDYERCIPPSKIAEIKRVYQHGVCGKNLHKHTVVVDRIGNIKIIDLFRVLQDDELVHYTSQRLLRISEEVVGEKEQVIWIIDLSGKIMQLASKKILDFLQRIITNLQTYFPELLYRLIFVNTPMLFDTIWTKITPCIAKETLQKVVMIGDEMSNIYQYAEPSILPDFLGGDVDEQDFLNERSEKPLKKEESESSEEEEVDFSALKQALGGLKIGGSSLQSVSQTPLNTEADDK